MKRILIDHLRRHRWMLALGMLLELGIVGGWAVWPRAVTELMPGLPVQILFCLFGLPLSLEIQKGGFRAMLLLPVRASSLGRAWWWAAVGIPASLMTTLLLICVVARAIIHPQLPVDLPQFLLVGALCWLWPGAYFTLLLRQPPVGRLSDWRSVRTIIFWFGSSVVMVGGILANHWTGKLLDYPIPSMLLGAVCLWLTCSGWSRAGELVVDRSAMRMSVAMPSAPLRSAPKRSREAQGNGGVPYFLRQVSLQTYAFGAFIFLSTVLVMRLHGEGWHRAVRASSVTIWLPLMFPLLLTGGRLVAQLRHLRTLPLTTSELGWLLLGSMLLPVIGFVATTMLFVSVVHGFDDSGEVALQLFSMAGMLAVVFALALWHGLRRSTYYFLWATAVLCPAALSILHVFERRLPLPFWVPAVAVVAAPLIAFAVLRRALNNSRVYRPSPAFAGIAGGALGGVTRDPA